jgi:hypothetical protein
MAFPVAVVSVCRDLHVGGHGLASCAVFSPDGRLLATSRDNSLTITMCTPEAVARSLPSVT